MNMSDEEMVRIGEKSISYKGHFTVIPTEVATALSEELELGRKKRSYEYGNLYRAKEALDTLIFNLAYLHPEMFGTREAVKKLYAWKPDQFQAGVDFKESGYYSKGDEDAPFLSEAFLYNLLGKDDARSLLGLLREALGTGL